MRRYPKNLEVTLAFFPLVFPRLCHTKRTSAVPRHNNSSLHHQNDGRWSKDQHSDSHVVIVANWPSVSHRVDERSPKLRNHRANMLSRRPSRCKLRATLLPGGFSRVADEKVMSRSIDIRAIRRSSVS